MATRRSVSAAAAAAGRFRVSLLATARLPSRSWAALSAAAAAAPEGAARASDVLATFGSFGVPAAIVVAATTGLLAVVRQLGVMQEKVAASDKAISNAMSEAAAITKANQDAANAAIAATEVKLAANKEAASAAIAASKEAASAVIAANKEAASAVIAATEAKLAAAEKVIAAMMAGVPVAAELATLKALKAEPTRGAPKDGPKREAAAAPKDWQKERKAGGAK